MSETQTPVIKSVFTHDFLMTDTETLNRRFTPPGTLAFLLTDTLMEKPSPLAERIEKTVLDDGHALNDEDVTGIGTLFTRVNDRHYRPNIIFTQHLASALVSKDVSYRHLYHLLCVALKKIPEEEKETGIFLLRKGTFNHDKAMSFIWDERFQCPVLVIYTVGNIDKIFFASEEVIMVYANYFVEINDFIISNFFDFYLMIKGMEIPPIKKEVIRDFRYALICYQGMMGYGDYSKCSKDVALNGQQWLQQHLLTPTVNNHPTNQHPAMSFNDLQTVIFNTTSPEFFHHIDFIKTLAHAAPIGIFPYGILVMSIANMCRHIFKITHTSLLEYKVGGINVAFYLNHKHELCLRYQDLFIEYDFNLEWKRNSKYINNNYQIIDNYNSETATQEEGNALAAAERYFRHSSNHAQAESNLTDQGAPTLLIHALETIKQHN